MIISGQTAEHVFRKVNQVIEEMAKYSIAHDRSKLSIEDLQRVVSQMYNMRIDKTEVSFSAQFVKGMIERYHDRAIILVKKDLSEDEKRFVATKELCHLINDQEEDFSPKGSETIDGLVYEFHLENAAEPAERRIQSEMFAEISATELLYPFRFRAADSEELKAKTSSLSKIAVHYGVPAFVVDRALRPAHMKLCTACWAMIKE